MAVDPAAELGLAAPVLTRIAGNGTNALGYVLAQGETMRIEAIAVDVDATVAAGGTVVAQFLAPSGEIIAESASLSTLVAGSTAEVTFAPFLPDTSALGFTVSDSLLQTGLVLTELPGGSTVHIEATDTGVVLTEARIWATGAPGTGDDTLPPLEPRYLFPLAGDVEVELAQVKATALFIDGPCRLQKRVLTFDVQPPQTLRCGGATYTYSANQGIQYLNYVVKGGTNDTGAAGVRGERDVFHAWTRLQRALNKGAGGSLAKVNNARRRIRRAVR